jgi:hypothetical protein
MNWRSYNPSVAPAGADLAQPFAAAPLWLEGSLAAVSTLAPVISIFPALGQIRSRRRRSPRSKT